MHTTHINTSYVIHEYVYDHTFHYTLHRCFSEHTSSMLKPLALTTCMHACTHAHTHAHTHTHTHTHTAHSSRWIYGIACFFVGQYNFAVLHLPTVEILLNVELLLVSRAMNISEPPQCIKKKCMYNNWICCHIDNLYNNNTKQQHNIFNNKQHHQQQQTTTTLTMLGVIMEY